MAAQIVIGLYESEGFARDVRNRLKTEGVAARDIALVVLHEIGPAPSTSGPELAALDADPLVLGNVRETFARFIRNGETAVLVRAEDEAEVGFASDIMALYEPVAIEVLTPRQPEDQDAEVRNDLISSGE
jgi:hypothetical protein